MIFSCYLWLVVFKQDFSVKFLQITSDPVMMSHSPLRMFEEYHDKCVLLSGQGPVEEIAKKIGFTNTVTIEEIREAYPNLDMVDHQRRPKTVSHTATFSLLCHDLDQLCCILGSK